MRISWNVMSRVLLPQKSMVGRLYMIKSQNYKILRRILLSIKIFQSSFHTLIPGPAWWKGLRWWYDDKVTRQLKIKCSSQHSGLMIFLSNGSYSHVKSSECPIHLKDHRRFTFWTQKMEFWVLRWFSFSKQWFSVSHVPFLIRSFKYLWGPPCKRWNISMYP